MALKGRMIQSTRNSALNHWPEGREWRCQFDLHVFSCVFSFVFAIGRVRWWICDFLDSFISNLDFIISMQFSFFLHTRREFLRNWPVQGNVILYAGVKRPLCGTFTSRFDVLTCLLTCLHYLLTHSLARSLTHSLTHSLTLTHLHVLNYLLTLLPF